MPSVERTGAPRSVRASLRGATVVLDDRPVLRGVDLELGPGIVVVRGPNGSGKTTLLRALAGLVQLVGGTRAVSADLLYLAHRPQLLRGLTVRENLVFLAAFRGIAAAPIGAALQRWGLGAEADRPVEHLSAGQRRRAALARLLTEPVPIALLDEPFAELDAEATALLRAEIARARERGAAIVVASHGHPELDALASCVYAIHDGILAAS